MSYLVTETETVSIGGVPLNTPAWTLSNLFDLWSGPPTRGMDVVIPNAQGQRPYPRRIDEWRVTLNLAVYGDMKWDGTPYVNWRQGLWDNIAHLRANAFDPAATPNGTRPLNLVDPAGLAWNASVIVERFAIGSAVNWFAVLTTADIIIPEGKLAWVAP